MYENVVFNIEEQYHSSELKMKSDSVEAQQMKLNKEMDLKVELQNRAQSSLIKLRTQVQEKKMLLQQRIEKAKARSNKDNKIQDEIMKYVRSKKYEATELLNEIKKN